MQNVMLSGDLGKMDSMRKNSQDGRFVLPKHVFVCLDLNINCQRGLIQVKTF